MIDPTNLLAALPKPVAWTAAAMLGGGLIVGGLETRYMTVGDFTKSYVLQLRAEIREIDERLERVESPETARVLREQRQRLLDELCYERPDDPYCK